MREWARDGALNSVTSIRMCKNSARQPCGMAFWEMGQSQYVEWFEKQELNVDTSALSDTDIADLVEAALALHVLTKSRTPLGFLGGKKVFADWLGLVLIFD